MSIFALVFQIQNQGYIISYLYFIFLNFSFRCVQVLHLYPTFLPSPLRQSKLLTPSNIFYYPHKKHAKKTTTYQSKLTFFNLGSPGSPFNDVNPTFISDKFSKLLNSSVSPTIVVDRQLSRLSSFTFKI